MKISKTIVLVASMLCAGAAMANRTEVDLAVGESAMQISLQKELYGILISDSDEVQAEYKAKGTFYKNDQLAQYQKAFALVCERDNAAVCPEVFFTKRTEQGIASMYPNGVLVLNEELASRINGNEMAFLLSHEYAHYKFNHSKQRMVVIAKSVVDNGVMIRDPEQALAVAGFIPSVREAHYAYEGESDAYGFSYIAKYGIAIDCGKMFAKITGGEAISNDKHESVDKRCAGYKP